MLGAILIPIVLFAIAALLLTVDTGSPDLGTPASTDATLHPESSATPQLRDQVGACVPRSLSLARTEMNP